MEQYRKPQVRRYMLTIVANKLTTSRTLEKVWKASWWHTPRDCSAGIPRRLSCWLPRPGMILTTDIFTRMAEPVWHMGGSRRHRLDATVPMHYDLHWSVVRSGQRVMGTLAGGDLIVLLWGYDCFGMRTAVLKLDWQDQTSGIWKRGQSMDRIGYCKG